MTDNSEPSYSATCYCPLRVDAELKQLDFRLITLLPGEWTSTIRCQLTVHNLNDPPPYETISYAWGDPQDTGIAEVDGTELTVPGSLVLCLRQLRSSGKPLRLWTDAICIDQTNLQERALQVTNMTVIYWRCTSMYVWLGLPDASFESLNPFEMALYWADDKHFYQYPGFSLSEETGEWVFRDNDAYRQMYELFADFVSRPWWTRLWCVQEICLCPKALVMIGEWEIPWTTIQQARQNHSRHDAECCKGVARSMPAKYTYFADHLLFLSHQSDYTSMDEVIRALRHKLCKDPRDKIYGLLGLLWKNPAAKIVPDYTLPVGELYRQVTQTIISQSEGDLRFLTGSGLGSDSHQLPSWTRNFAAPLHPVRASHEHARFRRYSLYSASGTTSSEINIVDRNTIGLSGIFIDRIERLGPAIKVREWMDPQGVLPNIQSWAELSGLSTLDRECEPGSAQERFWRILMADVYPNTNTDWRRIRNHIGFSLSSWFDDARARLAEQQEPLVTAHVYAFWAAVSNRVMFRTDKGHLGLCFEHSRPGDEVWVLAGGKVPFVLRRLDDGVDLVQGTAVPHASKLIGDCYLHGYMDGEGLPTDLDDLVAIHLK